MMSKMTMAKKCHLEQLYHVFSYLKIKHNSKIAFDPTIPAFDVEKFPRDNWKHRPYFKSHKNISKNAPEA